MEFEFQCAQRLRERERDSRIWTGGHPGVKITFKETVEKYMQILWKLQTTSSLFRHIKDGMQYFVIVFFF